jgi:sec-independent protein translocase protein TatA
VPNLGVSELIVIFMILLLVFGASRLPALGEGLGRTIRGFKRGIGGDEPGTAPSAQQPDKPKVSAQAKTEEPDDAELVEKK